MIHAYVADPSPTTAGLGAMLAALLSFSATFWAHRESGWELKLALARGACDGTETSG